MLRAGSDSGEGERAVSGRAARIAERVGAAVLLLASAAPFWAGRFLPFLDLPQHLGLAAVVAHHADPGSAFARIYELDLHVTPYWGYYGAMWLLGRALPLELANRLLFTAYAVGLPLAAAYLLASFGRDRRWAVLTVPLVFNTNLFLGFATFLLSIPLFLVALGLSERHLAADRARARHALPLALATTLVFAFHGQTYLLLGLCVAVLFLVHLRGPRWALARALPYAPSLLLFAAWFWRSFVHRDPAALGGHTAQHRGYGSVEGGLGAVYEPWRVVLEAMPQRLLGAFNDGSDTALGLVLLAVFAAALVLTRGPAPAPPAHLVAPPWRRALLARRCDLVVLALLLAYLLAPLEISGQWYVAPRHLVFAALVSPLLLAGRARGRRSLLLGAAAAVALAACANAALKIRSFQAQVGPFEQIARLLPPGGRVLGLPFDNGARGPVRFWPLLHWACYQQLLAGGDVGFSFAGLPSIPVRYRPGMQAPHPYEWRPDQLDWDTMGRYYDAFLVSGSPRGSGGFDLVRHAHVVERAGAFTLWRARTDRDGPAAEERTGRAGARRGW